MSKRKTICYFFALIYNIGLDKIKYRLYNKVSMCIYTSKLLLLIAKGKEMVKDTEYKSDVMDFTPAQILGGKITAVVVTLLLIVWFVLVAVGVVAIGFWDIFLGSVLLAMGITLLVSGAIQKNSVSVWLAFPFLVPAVIEFLCKFSLSSYIILYPLYIAIPAIGSLVCLTFAGGKKAHVKVILFFGLEAIFYLLNVLSIIQMFVSIILCIVLVLVAVTYIFIRIFRSNITHE